MFLPAGRPNFYRHRQAVLCKQNMIVVPDNSGNIFFYIRTDIFIYQGILFFTAKTN